MNFSVSKNTSGSVKEHFSAAVIGSGPAGLTAAIYLGRSKVDTVVFEKIIPGGYIINVEKIENYPGFVEGISGQELGKLYVQHAKRFGAKIINEETKKLELDKFDIFMHACIGLITSSFQRAISILACGYFFFQPLF